MSEFKNDNDYSFTAFGKSGFLYKKSYCHNVYKDTQWLTQSQNFSDWEYINLYARRSGRFLGRFYKGNFIPPKPK